MTITSWIAVAVIILTITALLKKFEVRVTLLTAGILLCLISLNPMAALNQFAKMMTSASLVQSITAAMGFAFLISFTKADIHLVSLLAKPLKKLGVLLIPACTIVTLIVNTAIPSASGCAAAVGATLIPIMIRAGIRPVGAGAAVLAGTIGSFLNPGSPHQNMVGSYVGISGMEFILANMTTYMVLWGISVVMITVTEFFLGDHKGQEESETLAGQETSTIEKVKYHWAIAPLVPLVVLILGNTCLPALKMGVAQAMVIGAIYTILVTQTHPAKATNQFFQGCGKGFADVVSIIISASVFAMGLQSAGLIQVLIELLKQSSDFARWGGVIGPYLMAILVGSGDAATMAFNEAVTPHAQSFGLSVISLGNLAYVGGALGRTMSPIAGVVIVIAGLCQSNPIDIVKRTAPGMILGVVTLLIFF